MNLDRYMVTLFFEIRRNLPSSLNSKLKLSSPDLGDSMVALYKSIDDENMRLLIEIFLERAGEGWLEKAKPAKKYYRGVEVNPKKTKTKKASNPEDKKPKQKTKSKNKVKYYRGVRVDPS